MSSTQIVFTLWLTVQLTTKRAQNLAIIQSSSGISDPFIDEGDTEREEEQTEQSEETLHGIEPYRFEPEVTLSSLGITMMLSVATITAMGDK